MPGSRRISPPSHSLHYANGVWYPPAVAKVSYPDDGNDVCLAIEDKSYWFQHRNDVIVAAIRQIPPSGPIYDVGGGNGFVSRAMESAGYDVVLLEPGSGATNALRRGITNVIQSTLDDAALDDRSIDAVGIFDVVEHIGDDLRFLSQLHRTLKPGGRVYCTVPAFQWLWSNDDVTAGHFRRYNRRSLAAAFRKAGFEIDFLSYFFSWLPLPIFFVRVIPHRVGWPWVSVVTPSLKRADHHLPIALQPITTAVHRWELNRIAHRRTIPFGTSLICVARVS